MAAISVTRALAELKMLAERINNHTALFTPCHISKGLGAKQTVPNTNLTPTAAAEKIKAAHQSLSDLVERRNRLKSAIMKSNAETMVTIGGLTMTVMDAIERKRSISYDDGILQRMRMAYTQALHAIEQGNRKLGDQIDQAVLSAYSNDKGKVTPEQYEAVAAPRKSEHELNLIDPLDLNTRIQKMTDAIASFTTEVDFVLSESNARTTINVD